MGEAEKARQDLLIQQDKVVKVAQEELRTIEDKTSKLKAESDQLRAIIREAETANRAKLDKMTSDRESVIQNLEKHSAFQNEYVRVFFTVHQTQAKYERLTQEHNEQVRKAQANIATLKKNSDDAKTVREKENLRKKVGNLERQQKEKMA